MPTAHQCGSAIPVRVTIAGVEVEGRIVEIADLVLHVRIGQRLFKLAGMNELAIVLCLAVLTWLSQPAEDGSSTRRSVHRVLAILTAVAASLALAEYTQRVAIIRF